MISDKLTRDCDGVVCSENCIKFSKLNTELKLFFYFFKIFLNKKLILLKCDTTNRGIIPLECPIYLCNNTSLSILCIQFCTHRMIIWCGTVFIYQQICEYFFFFIRFIYHQRRFQPTQRRGFTFLEDAAVFFYDCKLENWWKFRDDMRSSGIYKI